MQPMPLDDLTLNGAHTLTVCNACRYCEQYCPVFPAMEERLTFERVDLAYLSNLCHNCGECLYACQYAPPHEFGINVPRTLAEIRFATYEEYAWPRPLAAMFRAHTLFTASALTVAFTGMILLVARLTGSPVQAPVANGNFYAIVPHGVMVTLFGGVFAFVGLAIGLGLTRFVREVRASASARPEGLQPRTTPTRSAWRALRDGMTLRHLHATGPDCVSSEEERRPWRRWAPHLVLGGFLLGVASTAVAAV